DEGKGKVVDFAAGGFDLVARATGGNNAGHTIYIKGNKHIFHLIPSSITWEDVQCLLGNGMVVDLFVMLKEVHTLREKGYAVNNLAISGNAHVITVLQKMHDLYQERSKSDKKKIGTTGRGIGPTYADKKHRTGLRINDLLDKDVLKEKLTNNIMEKFSMFRYVYGEEHEDIVQDMINAIPDDSLYDEYRTKIKALGKNPDINSLIETLTDIYFSLGRKIKHQVVDVSIILRNAVSDNKRILIEGAQGLLLDIDHGTYPFVTSSNPSAGGLKTGLGISRVDEVYSLIKAYTTRVGGGPFPTELTDEHGEYLREKGGEYGSTTGRPRRCGWHDAVLTRHTEKINGNKIIITKLDVLTGLKKLKICNTYRYTGPRRVYNGEVIFPGKIIKDFPADAGILEHCVPGEWVEVEGWNEDITEAKSVDELPENAKKYLETIEELGGVKIALISVGPERDQTIEVPDVWTSMARQPAIKAPAKEPAKEETQIDRPATTQPSATATTSTTTTPAAKPAPIKKEDTTPRSYKAIIYDMDNTLVATDEYVFRLLKKTAQTVSRFTTFPIPTDDRIRAVQAKNLPFEDIFDNLFPDPKDYIGDEPLAKVILAKYRETAKTLPYIAADGGIELFDQMDKKGTFQVVVTNRVKMASTRLNQAGYPKIDYIFSPETKEERKPNPKAYKLVLKTMQDKGITPDDILSIGDHTDDYLASKRAGLDFVAVLTGGTSKEEFETAGLDKSRIVDSLAEVKGLMK
ncbi:adenylosuccinate synthase, partial [Nanoarchaeota archaeon]